MVHHAFKAALALAGAVALSGCGDMITGGPLIRPGEPLGTIRVANATSYALNIVAISNCSASTYGLNRLPSGMAIPVGGYYDFTVSAGCWDVNGGTFAAGDARGRIQVQPGQVFTLRIY